RCGEKIYNLKAKVNSTHELTWLSGEWRGNTRAELEKGIPDLGDYRLLVCTMNLEYYLATYFDPNSSMGPDSYYEHQIQRTKVNKALSLINADAYGLVEIEQGQDALAEIAGDLNAKHPDRNYTYIDDGGQPNGSYTKAGYVYDANKLRPIGALQDFSSGTIRGERHKMMCFEEIATGERFIFSVNHFKAKSGNGSGKDADQGDGQGIFNASRTAEAQALINHYKTRYSPAIKEKDILVMGDLNAYAKEDPITLLLENGMIDLHRAFHADSSYSYQFGARAGYLDHALCNSTLYKQVTGMAGFHINSDENDNYTYDGSWSDETMFRSSDHDPVLVGLSLDSTLTYEPTPTLNNAEVMAGESDKLIISNAFKDNQPSYYAIHTVSGLLVERREITSGYQQIELPAAPGIYIVYIYADGKVYQRKMIVR
ncbi:MAG: T9SS type A sorting domain-containing protein, partial [Paludibacteraceae bacterium]|nr:T9SS type A sorting domain-containing protein [Paludibacteraceae bacterium]